MKAYELWAVVQSPERGLELMTVGRLLELNGALEPGERMYGPLALGATLSEVEAKRRMIARERKDG